MGEFVDPLTNPSDPESWWSRTLAAEAMPGVLTPMGWSVFGWSAELSMRRAYHAIGALPRSELGIPARPQDRIISVFHGRAAARVDFMLEMGDAIPGTSGKAVAEQVLGFVPPRYTSKANIRRYPSVVTTLPRTFLSAPKRVAAIRAESESWYREQLARTPSLGLDQARRQFSESLDRFAEAMAIQAIGVFGGVQPVYDQMMKLIASTGLGDLDLMSSYGSHEELTMIEDLWALSRGTIDSTEFLLRQGFHGPGEGEISATVWREDQTPLQITLDGYRNTGDEFSPLMKEQQKREARQDAEATLLRALPTWKRPLARAIITKAQSHLPLRGAGKVAFLQNLDIARAATRRIGALLVDEGVLGHTDDAFLFTKEELVIPTDDRTRDLIEFRRERFKHYQDVDVPLSWQGVPTVGRTSERPAPGRVAAGDVVRGEGTSPGRVEGTVRVVVDPALTDLEPGEILVCHTTDPSWASVMFLARALVVDIGGQLSHASVVAREMGIPCVMGTGDGTTVLRSGDRIRIDGRTGTIEVLDTTPTAVR